MHRVWSKTLRRWVLLVCLLAQAAVFTAPLWHHHDDDGDDDDCAVCAAVGISQRVDVPTPPPPLLLIGQDTVVGILVVDAQADSSVLVVRSAHARGPPVAL